MTKQMQFTQISNIEECNFHPVLQDFYSMGISGITGENIQNSLDGKNRTLNEPVIVKINFGTMGKKDIPAIDEIEAHVNSLVGQSEYTSEQIEHMKKALQNDKITYISFEDENTKGLTGAKNGQSNNPVDTFGIYAYSKGFHAVESDQQYESARGGSHGIGKIASNSASDLNLMFFANCDKFGNQHIGGTIQLIEHRFGDHCYRATGYFTNIEHLDNSMTRYIPYENSYDGVFKKDTVGLKIVIPFFRDEFADETQIIKSICDRFALALLENNLVVYVNGKEISKNTIEKFINDPQYYQQETGQIKKEFTPLYVQTYLQQEPIAITISNGHQEYEFKLYFTYNEEISKGRMAIFRTVGMKIEDFKVNGYTTKPFNAVLVGGVEEDKYLKSLEDPSHTTIMNPKIKDPTLKKRANKFIRNLQQKLREIIDEHMNANNPVDGSIDTSDILYTIESEFKKQLEKAMGTVRIRSGKKLTQTKITAGTKKKGSDMQTGEGNGGEGGKTGDGKGGRKGTEASGQGKGGVGGTGKQGDSLKRKKQKEKATNENSESKEVYSVKSNLVQRLILGEKELLNFHFDDQKAVKDAKSCNISFSIVDGMGEEYTFDLSKNYNKILDQRTKKAYSIQQSKLIDVEVTNGKIQLEMALQNNYNRALKFVYYVEV